MSDALQLFLALGLMLFAAKALGYASIRLGQPGLLGELLAGLILGPTIINLFAQSDFFPNAALIESSVLMLAEMGVLMLLFTAGLGIQPKYLLSVTRPALLAGLAGVVFPLIFITPIITLFDYTLPKALFISLTLAAMSTAIGAQVMLELGVLHQKEGLTLLGAALVDDLCVILGVSLFLAVNPGDVAVNLGEHRPLGEVLLRLLAFVIFGGGAAWFLLPRLLQWVHQANVTEGGLALAVVASLLLGVAAEALGGLAAIAGAFMAGLAMGQAKPALVERLQRSVHSLNYGFLVPLFFVGIGLKANLRLLGADLLPFALVLLVAAVLSKSLGVMLGSYAGGTSRLCAFRVGMGMISRGEVGLIMTTIGINAGILAPEAFTILVFIVLVTTFITPPLVYWSFSERVRVYFQTWDGLPA
jgi:Kef-type K+ transport system membrane component KefB